MNVGVSRQRIQMITIARVQFPAHKACGCAGHHNLLPGRTHNHVTLHHRQKEQKAKIVLTILIMGQARAAALTHARNGSSVCLDFTTEARHRERERARC